MVRKPILLQIVGFQNSGKTTVVKKLIQCLAADNFNVATIKHHGHGGKPDIVEGKDSSEHISSGASASLIEGDGRILLQAEKGSWTLSEQIKILEILRTDIILIEGHKREKYPKIVLARNIDDLDHLSKLKNIQAVLFWNEECLEMKSQLDSVPFFSIDDYQCYEWIYNYLTNELK
ncbi:molybdopterin-guanine dinucleotide biosynthesis protein B [Cytobacillus massiliigabonensis]|uniref:molybdopterin-guanine dinucleotide biosynthesis protein B n=1 Tax=Cytobacillus massiliigabonensis TaxID=1871011 RepID=UPI000C85F6E4|nr:molybdopterin-guanine dinucleotide biosynthesis protein B [Cytobacillus massiliigabonensis]